ncbi:MAG: HNH endonuclease [Myxococcaceae bacterium]
MNPHLSSDLSQLDDREITLRVVSTHAHERDAFLVALRHLAEFDRRKLFRNERYTSLFDYCSKKLRLSNGSCHRRSHGAALIRRFPAIIDYLADGRVSLTKVVIAEKLFTPENVVPLLEQLANSTQHQVEKLAVAAFPKPAIKDSIRKRSTGASGQSVVALAINNDAAPQPAPSSNVVLSPTAALSEPKPAIAGAPLHALSADPLPSVAAANNSPVPNPMRRSPSTTEHADALPLFASGSATPPKRPDKIVPINDVDNIISFTANDSVLEQIRQAKSLLSHKFPGCRLEDVFRECLEIAIPVLLKRRIGAGPAKKRATSAAELESASRCEAAQPIAATSSAAERESPSRCDGAQPIAATTSAEELRSTSPSSVSTTGAWKATAKEPHAARSTRQPDSHTSAAELTVACADALAESSGTSSSTEGRSGASTQSHSSAAELSDFEGEEPIVPADLFARERRSRYIPRDVASAVWLRDGGCCSFVSADGNRCGSTYKLEIDHKLPFALGGPATLSNLRLCCRAHNELWSDQWFGGDCWAHAPWNQLEH